MEKLRLILISTEVALFAGACSLFGARSDPTRYFVLTTSSAPRPVAAPPTITVGIERVELPEYLVRPELVTRSGANQLRVAEYDVWGEPLKDSFARTLRRDLEKQLGVGVSVAPFDAAARPDVAVDVEVRRFERVAGEGAVLDARWTLRDVRHGTVLAQRTASERQAVAKEDAQAAVGALSRTVDALAGEVAAAVRADDRRRHEAAHTQGATHE